jgi:ATP-dependent Clp protease ATP-binding subunit ClpC
MIKYDLLKKMTDFARKCLERADQMAEVSGSFRAEPVHLLEAVYSEKGCLGSNILHNMGVRNKCFALEKKNTGSKNEKAKPFNTSAKHLQFSDNLKWIITRAFAIASRHQYPYVGTEHLTYALLETKDEQIQKIMSHCEDLEKKTTKHPQLISNFKNNDDLLMNLPKILNLPDVSFSKNKKSGKSGTPNLDQFCINLNKDVIKRQELIIGREKEIDRIANILCRKNKNNPVLIGDPGVGKTAIVSGLAERITTGRITGALINKEIRMLDMASVVAGTSFRGEFEARIKKIIEESASHKNIILFIDELHSIVGAGNASGGLDAANILKPALSRGTIQCIGATTTSEYKKHIEKDPALERRFQPVKIAEPSLEETQKIIEGIKASYEQFHNVIMTPEAIASSVELSARYLTDRHLPDKAIDLIDEAASWVRSKNKISDFAMDIKKADEERSLLVDKKNELVNLEKYEEAAMMRQQEKMLTGKIQTLKKKQKEVEKVNPISVTSFDIATVVFQITGIPVEKIVSQATAKIKIISKNLNQNIIGQKNAIREIVETMYRSFSGISNPDRPMGSFLFLGPTGVGKTLSAKILARELFESDQALIRIDMSEFMERHSISQLIGAPAGYVGFGEGGKLTEKIRLNPYSVVLFDEIEKAHPDVFNLLLQILEEGILTDAEGRTVSFKNAVVILTSNIGTSRFTQTAGIGFSTHSSKKEIFRQFDVIRSEVLKELKRQLKPELLNRLDSVLVFEPLGTKELKKIGDLELEKLKARLAQRKVNLKVAKNVSAVIASVSLNVNEGARLIRKNIQNQIENRIAELIIKNRSPKKNNFKIEVQKGKVFVSPLPWKN